MSITEDGGFVLVRWPWRSHRLRQRSSPAKKIDRLEQKEYNLTINWSANCVRRSSRDGGEARSGCGSPAIQGRAKRSSERSAVGTMSGRSLVGGARTAPRITGATGATFGLAIPGYVKSFSPVWHFTTSCSHIAPGVGLIRLRSAGALARAGVRRGAAERSGPIPPPPSAFGCHLPLAGEDFLGSRRDRA